MKDEEYLQWLEYEKDIGDIIECPICHQYIAWDEYVANNGMCTDCFDELAADDIQKGII